MLNEFQHCIVLSSGVSLILMQYSFYTRNGCFHRDKFDNEYIGPGVTQTYTVDNKGAYRFRVTCSNKKCNDSDKDSVESDCVAKYK